MKRALLLIGAVALLLTAAPDLWARGGRASVSVRANVVSRQRVVQRVQKVQVQQVKVQKVVQVQQVKVAQIVTPVIQVKQVKQVIAYPVQSYYSSSYCAPAQVVQPYYGGNGGSERLDRLERSIQQLVELQAQQSRQQQQAPLPPPRQ